MTAPTLVDVLLNKLDNDPDALEVLADRLLPLLARRLVSAGSARRSPDGGQLVKGDRCSRCYGRVGVPR